MVYLGRPSHGCFTCRARRIKCDEGRPTCRRCEKSKRECGGYKPEWDAIVPNSQSQSRSGPRPKVPISRHKTGSTSSHTSGQSSSSQQEERQTQSLTLTPPKSPTIPLTERAACLFAANFILLPHNTHKPWTSGTASPHSQQGFLSYLAPLLQLSPEESPLRSAFTACSLALLSNLEKSSNIDLKTLTLKSHTLALGRTHAALKDPITAEQDSTLATVLLLSLFESITAVKETEMLLWKTHINGTIQLVKSRGRDDLRGSKIGRVLFSAVRQNIISLALSHGQGPPLGVEFWMDGMEDEIGGLMAKSQRLVLQTAEVRAEVSRTMERVTTLARRNHLSGRESGEIHELLDRVRLLDREIAGFLGGTLSSSSSVPPFQTLTWIGEVGDDRFSGDYAASEVYPGRVDVYPDVMTASLWNTARVSRLILASSNIRLMAWLSNHGGGGGGDYRDLPEYIITRQFVKASLRISLPLCLSF